jgi:hypothetical protein
MAKDYIIVNVTKYKKSQRKQLFADCFQIPGFTAFIKRSNSETFYEFHYAEKTAPTNQLSALN